jgi:hypothetical protein
MEIMFGKREVKIFKELATAFLGFATRGNSAEPVACYNYDGAISTLMETRGWSEEESAEFLEHNYVNSWTGDGTPFFVKLAQSFCEDCGKSF